VKEINLISQDSTYYGLDLRPNHSRAISSPEKFSAAAKSLAGRCHHHLHPAARTEFALKGDFWIRLLYTHPAHWTDELIQTIANAKRSPAMWTCRSSTSTKTCSNACAAKPRSNTSLI
jgi:ribosomal protein S12 methylthiotransferase